MEVQAGGQRREQRKRVLSLNLLGLEGLSKFSGSEQEAARSGMSFLPIPQGQCGVRGAREKQRRT